MKIIPIALVIVLLASVFMATLVLAHGGRSPDRDIANDAQAIDISRTDIQNLHQQLIQGNITLPEFLNKIGHSSNLEKIELEFQDGLEIELKDNEVEIERENIRNLMENIMDDEDNENDNNRQRNRR